MENKNNDIKNITKSETIDTIYPISQKKRIALFLIFLIGVEFSFPTVLPIGLMCAATLLFQKNKKANFLALFLLLIQVLSIYIFFNVAQVSN